MPTVTAVLVVVVTLTPLRVVSMEPVCMFTFGAVVEEYILVRAADDVAIALLPGVVMSPVALAALSVDVALAPGATAEVDVETAVAG